MDRPRRSFVRILSPAKEAGIGSLRIGTEMWSYLPNVERIVKIPPSMMLQPWMGSDFTNDDLVKESSILEDYMHKVLATVQLGGEAVVQVEAVPLARDDLLGLELLAAESDAQRLTAEVGIPR